MTRRFCLTLLLCLGAACGDDDDDTSSTGDKAEFEKASTLEVKKYVQGQLQALYDASKALQDAAPEPDNDGWNASDDKAAVDDMKAAWADTRDAYERVEGSIAVLFGELDISTDERYDGFIAVEPDDNLFDGEGVTGVHGIERILWSDSTPAKVVRFEETLEGYKKAAFPATEQEADDFKNGLAERLVTDCKKMLDDFSDTALEPSTAFWGTIASTQEQSEKTTLAASAEDESRYSQRTLADMRANLEGARAVFKAFRAWAVSATSTAQVAEIESRFDEVDDAYTEIEGDAIPAVPDEFDPDDPSEADLDTPFGKLWSLLEKETDPESDESLISKMSDAADEMGIEGIEEE